jgi:DNA-binding CsgD family transcriptional regulator
MNWYDRLIGLIYEGIADDAQWGLALAQVAETVGAAGVGLGMQDLMTHQFRGVADFGIDRNLPPTYRRLAPYSKIWQEIGRRRRPLTDQTVMTKAAFVRTELFTDWFVPQGFHSVMAVPILFKESASAIIVALGDRSRGDFEAADMSELGRFADHFGRALSIRLNQERTADDLAAANLILEDMREAVLLVDRDVRLQHANAAGRAILEGGKGIRLHGGRLEMRDPLADATLAQLVAGARGGELRLSRSGQEGWVIQVHPCTNGVGHSGAGFMIVRIKDPGRSGEPPTPARLRELLGLSRRQSEVVAELAGGGTEAEAALKLGLAQPTLHTHLQRVYDRLKLCSRAELLERLGWNGFDTTRRPKKF